VLNLPFIGTTVNERLVRFNLKLKFKVFAALSFPGLLCCLVLCDIFSFNFLSICLSLLLLHSVVNNDYYK